MRPYKKYGYCDAYIDIYTKLSGENLSEERFFPRTPFPKTFGWFFYEEDALNIIKWQTLSSVLSIEKQNRASEMELREALLQKSSLILRVKLLYEQTLLSAVFCAFSQADASFTKSS